MIDRFVIRRKDTGWYIYSANHGPRFGSRSDIQDARIFTKFEALRIIKTREEVRGEDVELPELEMLPVNVTIELKESRG